MRLTSFELELAAQDIEQQFQDRVRWGQDLIEKHEANDDRLLLVKSKTLVKGPVVDEDRE